MRAPCTGLERRGKDEYPRARSPGETLGQKLRAPRFESTGVPECHAAPIGRCRPAAQPEPKDYDFDLDRALGSVVGIRSIVPADAFSAETLGTERAGNGVLIREDGVVLTIGYLITEAESVWLTFSDGRVVQGHALGYDQETGFGLVQALARLDLPALPLGQSAPLAVGENVVVGGAGGRHHSVAAHVAARQEFAGYWEYVLDEAIFTAPAHPNWGGTAMIGAARRSPRHRLAAARAAGREGQPSIST